MAKKFEAKLGLDTKDFDSELKDASGAFGKFGAELGRIAAGITAAAGVFNVLIDWAKQQNFGMETLNVTMHVTKQLLTDLITGQGFHLKESIKLGQEWTKIQEGNAKDIWEQAKLQRELNQLTVQAADNTLSHAQKLEVLTKAIAKEKELKEFLIKDAQEEIRYWEKELKLNQTNLKAREELYKAAARYEQAMGMDSRRLQSQYTAEVQAQRDATKEAAAAIREYGELIANMPTPVNKISLGLASLPNFTQRVKIEGTGAEDILAGAPDQIQNMNKELSDLQINLMGLTESFAMMFRNVDQGFEGLVQGVMRSLGRLVADLMAKAFILTILSAITGVPLSGAMFKNLLLGPNVTGLINGGATLSGVGAMTPASGPLNIEVNGVIRGKDIILSNRRFEEGF